MYALEGRVVILARIFYQAVRFEFQKCVGIGSHTKLTRSMLSCPNE